MGGAFQPTPVLQGAGRDGVGRHFELLKHSVSLPLNSAAKGGTAGKRGQCENKFSQSCKALLDLFRAPSAPNRDRSCPTKPEERNLLRATKFETVLIISPTANPPRPSFVSL